jgi:hypothetical protein
VGIVVDKMRLLSGQSFCYRDVGRGATLPILMGMGPLTDQRSRHFTPGGGRLTYLGVNHLPSLGLAFDVRHPILNISL